MSQDEHLEWMSDGQELWNSIVDLHPTILTGLPMGKWAEPQKVGVWDRLVVFRSYAFYTRNIPRTRRNALQNLGRVIFTVR